MEGTKIDVLHSEHREWLSKLDFYKDDIMILRKRIEEIAMKNTSRDVLAMVEHFQTQFIFSEMKWMNFITTSGRTKMKWKKPFLPTRSHLIASALPIIQKCVNGWTGLK